MIRNYIKIAFRNLTKNKGYTIINILGLAFGLTCTLFISIFVYNEISFDKFHKNSELIYRVSVKGAMAGNDLNMAVTSTPMAEALVNEFPEITKVTRILQTEGRLVEYGDKQFNETAKDFFFADSTFFEVFSFPFINGDPKTSLDNPYSIVLTETTAKKYFGDDDPIGKNLSIENDTTLYQVTGVIEDIPANSHFHFSLMGSFHSLNRSRNISWLSHGVYTYVLTVPEINEESFRTNINGLVDKYVGPEIQQVLGVTMEQFSEQGNSFGYFIQNLEDIHLHSDLQYELEQNGNPSYVYIFSVLGFIILLVACINFMNLATARSSKRAREVGIRKVSGSLKKHLIYQFLVESTVISFFSLIIAIGLVVLLMPYFNNLIDSNLVFNPFNSIILVIVLAGLAISVGLLAGFYPAFVLASVKPLQVLKGKLQSGAKGSKLRSILVVVQFACTIVIMLGTFIVFNQLNYMQTKNLGFDKKNTLVIKRADALNNQIEAFKQELSGNSNIISVGNSVHIPGMIFNNNAHFLEGRSFNDIYLLMQTAVSYEFLEVMEMEMAEGRFFSIDYPTDSFAVVINESTVKSLGIEDPVGKRFMFPGRTPEDPIRYQTIIGVVKDFHFQSMHENINPVIIEFMRGNYGGFVLIRIEGDNEQEVIQFVENTWKNFVKNNPIEYVWLEDDFDKIFKPEKQTSKILLVFSFFSIFISCLGLFGLISFTTSQRTNEIGIRKTLGSSVGQVVIMLFRETAILLTISTILAIPSYFIFEKWLQNFAFGIKYGPGIFAVYLLFFALLTLLISLLTVSYQSVKSANINPADALRHE